MNMKNFANAFIPVAAIAAGVIVSIYASGYAIWAWVCVILALLIYAAVTQH